MSNSKEIKFRQWDPIRKMMHKDLGAISDNNTQSGWAGFPYVSLERYPIMQYTGKKDVTYKEIYEGDVVEGYVNHPHVMTIGEIVYDSYWSAFGNKNLSGTTLLFNINNIKIIGNIYQNPELLEK